VIVFRSSTSRSVVYSSRFSTIRSWCLRKRERGAKEHQKEESNHGAFSGCSSSLAFLEAVLSESDRVTVASRCRRYESMPDSAYSRYWTSSTLAHSALKSVSRVGLHSELARATACEHQTKTRLPCEFVLSQHWKGLHHTLHHVSEPCLLGFVGLDLEGR
jgi:hypothetical protein